MSSRKIEDESQYEKARLWVLEASKKLEDPLLDDEDRSKTNRIYDITCGLMREYQRSEIYGKPTQEEKKLDLSNWDL